MTTEDLRVLATGGDLTMPAFTVEPALLSSLPGAANVLWQVEMSLPSGERLTSPTFITRWSEEKKARRAFCGGEKDVST